MYSDTLIYIKELADIKQQLTDVSKDVMALKPSLIEKMVAGALPALCGALIGGLISLLLFKLNQASDKKKVIDADNRAKNDLTRNLYGEAFGLQTLIVNTYGQQGYHQLYRAYFAQLSILSVDDKEKNKFIELQDSEYEKFVAMSMKLKDLLQHLSNVVGQYYFINSQSPIMQLYSDFFEKSKKSNVESNFNGIKEKNVLIKEFKDRNVAL